MKHIGVIGCGGWGKNHVRTWAELGALHSICDGNQAALDAARPLAQGAFESTDASAIIDNSDIKGVVIATPSPTHYALVMRALEAGKDVLVEKPMALKVADAEKMNAKAKEKGCLLMVGHVLEFHPAILKLREFIQSGELGKVLTIQSNRLNLGKIRNEENALWSFAPHDLAIILRLVGEMPIGVSCHGGAYLNSEIADSTITALEFRSKVLATISVSWLYPYKEHTLVVVGSKQMAVFNDLLPWEEKLQLYPHRVQWTEGKNPIAERAEPIRVPLQKTEPLKAECEHFLSCIKTRSVPLTDGASGYKVLTLLQGAQASLDKRGQMVSLGVAAPTLVPDTYVHPTAIVDKSADLGTGTKVWHYSHVMGGAKFGKNCVVGQNVFVAKNVVVGNGVKIQNNVSLYEGVVLEDFVFCGPSMVFTNVINPRSHIERKNEYRKTIVGKGATIGANATIVCGHNIGRFAFIGAGAVVTKDIPSHALVVGNPARVIGFVCECGVGRLDFQGDHATCASCKRHYRKADGQCQEESHHVDESTATRLEAAA